MCGTCSEDECYWYESEDILTTTVCCPHLEAHVSSKDFIQVANLIHIITIFFKFWPRRPSMSTVASAIAIGILLWCVLVLRIVTKEQQWVYSLLSVRSWPILTPNPRINYNSVDKWSTQRTQNFLHETLAKHLRRTMTLSRSNIMCSCLFTRL